MVLPSGWVGDQPQGGSSKSVYGPIQWMDRGPAVAARYGVPTGWGKGPATRWQQQNYP